MLPRLDILELVAVHGDLPFSGEKGRRDGGGTGREEGGEAVVRM